MIEKWSKVTSDQIRLDTALTLSQAAVSLCVHSIIGFKLEILL